LKLVFVGTQTAAHHPNHAQRVVSSSINPLVFIMKILSTSSLLAAAVIVSMTTFAQGQSAESTTAPLTRAQVKMDRDEFLKTHLWQAEGGWLLKPGVQPPEGVTAPTLTRAQVKMDRDEFIKTHQWQAEVGWMLKPGMEPPEGVKAPILTRTQVKMDRDEFLKTHQWQNEVGWVLKPGMEPPMGRK
jgi:hypothetical protein